MTTAAIFGPLVTLLLIALLVWVAWLLVKRRR